MDDANSGATFECHGVRVRRPGIRVPGFRVRTGADDVRGRFRFFARAFLRGDAGGGGEKCPHVSRGVAVQSEFERVAFASFGVEDARVVAQ